MSKRIEWVDIGKFICIMFVILSHLESNTSVLTNFYSPIFLTGFLFLSGYVYKQKDNFKNHLKNKFFSLFVPWFIFSTILILLSAILTFNDNHEPFYIEFLKNLAQIRTWGDLIWFVAALFIAYIPFYFIIKSNKPKLMLPLFFVLAVGFSFYSNYFPVSIFPWGKNALPWHIEYVCYAVFWMMLGYYFKAHIEKKTDKFIKWYYLLILTVVYLVLAYIPIYTPFLEIPMSYLRSCIGVFLLVYVCKLIKPNKYFLYVGQNTLIYFAFHGKVYSLMQTALHKFIPTIYNNILSNVWLSSIFAIALTIVISIILIVPSIVINKWFPWILGKKKK